MRLAAILFAAFFAAPALAQFSTAGICSAAGATIQVGVSAPYRLGATTGAPYAAREVAGSLEKSTWRDSSGRTRTEEKGANGARNPCRSFLITLEDPVAGFIYLLDPVNRIAHRVKAVATSTPVSSVRPVRPDEESLGTKTMLDVTVDGRKQTRTTPPPPRRPNDPPRTVVVESWWAPGLDLTLYQKTTSQDDGVETVREVKELTVGEPDPALLRIPQDYKTVDETGPFTVVTGTPTASPLGPARTRTAPPTTPLAATAGQQATSPVPLRGFDRFLAFDDSGDHSAAISLGDVNGDGNLDVVLSTGRHWESPIHLYFGDGKGGFKSIGDIGSQGYASYGAPLVDLNGDGNLDLAVGTDTGGDKPIFFGDGKGHFTLSGSFGDPRMPSRNIAAGDLNGDGFPDIAIANRGVQSYVYLNDGKGGFAQKIAFGGPGDSTVTVAIADVNHDGKPDLVLAHRDGQQSVALLNDGHANFSDPRPFGPPDGDTRAVAVGDLNGDGFPDVVACHLEFGTFVYFNDGHGNFPKSVRIADASDQFYSLAVVDLNRDGKLDIVGGNVGKANVVFFNEKDGSAFQRVEFGEAGGGIATYGLAIADVDKDGYPDIAVARTGASSGIFFSTALGTAPVRNNIAPAPPSFAITIRPSADGLTLPALFAKAYGMRPAQVTGNGLADPTKYDAAMTIGTVDPKDAELLFQQALCAYFRVTVARGSTLIVNKR